MLLILVVTSYVTTCLSFFIYCLPHHLFYLDMCDVTTYVTPIVGSLSLGTISKGGHHTPWRRLKPKHDKGSHNKWSGIASDYCFTAVVYFSLPDKATMQRCFWPKLLHTRWALDDLCTIKKNPPSIAPTCRTLHRWIQSSVANRPNNVVWTSLLVFGTTRRTRAEH